jgi:hypothetical protein
MKPTTMRPERELERVLLAFEHDIIDANDEEVLSAARELGMNPAMKGSSAFFGVTLLVHFGKPSQKPVRRRRQPVARRRIPKDDVPPSS